MSHQADSVADDWKPIGRTGSMTRRFTFPNYAATSTFLDALNALSEQTGLYPDLGFATTYVNVTVAAETEEDRVLRDSFVARTNQIYKEQAP